MHDNHTNHRPFSTGQPAPACTEGHPRGEGHLVLTIGGTGNEFGLRLALEVMRAGAHGNLRIRYVDIDPAGLEGVAAGDCYVMNHVPAHDLIEAIEANPAAFPGCELLGDPEQLWQDLGASDELVRGAQTRRSLGNLALRFHLWRYPRPLSSFLERPIRELHAFANTAVGCWAHNGHGRTEGRQHLTITLVFSACGGTGSGIAPLLNDYLHHHLRHYWGVPRYNIDADILLPGVLLPSADDPQALMANTWAFFLELAARFQRRLPALQLGYEQVARSRRPYGQVYLYDTINAQGQLFTDRQQVTQVMAAVWQLRKQGPSASEYQARLVDLHLTVPNLFSAAGASVLAFPLEQIRQQFGLRLGARLVRDGLLQAPSDAEKAAQEFLADFLNRQPGFRDLPAFRHDRSHKPLRVDLQRFQGLKRKELPRALENLAQRQGEQVQATLADLVARTQAGMATSLDQAVQELLNRPGGLCLAGHFLAGLDALLSGQRERLLGQDARVRRELQERQAAVAREHSLPWWRRFSLTPRARYLARQQALLETDLLQRRTMARLELANGLRRHVADHQQAVAGWNAALVELEKRLVAAEDEFLRQEEEQRSVVVESVVCPDDIERLYADHFQSAQAQAREGLTFRWMADEGSFVLHYQVREETAGNSRVSILSPEGIERHVAYCRSFWQPLEEISIEQVLAEQGRTPQEVLSHLEARGAPLVASDEVKQIPAERHLMVLGAPGGASGFFKGYVGQSGLHLVANGDKRRISLLSTVHGLNPFNLMQAPSWQQAYTEAVAQGQSLHIYPEFEGEISGAALPASANVPHGSQAEPVAPVEEVADVPVHG
jgi:hypothetical protein